MTPEMSPIPMSSPRSRPRAATDMPLRHPKPLTPSDIHSILEREQEAMVNRLSRELSLLRQQTASVASTTSNTSNTTFSDSFDAISGSTYITGPIIPTASRRHRSSSSLSASYFPIIQGSRASSVSGIKPSRPVDPLRTNGTRSREPSLTSLGQIETTPSSAALQSHVPKQVDLSTPLTRSPRLYPHRGSISQQRTASGSIVSRHDDVAHQRGEFESIKRENEMLRRRVRELELELNLQKYQE